MDMPHIIERVLREWKILAEQTRMAAALRQSEERYRTLVHTLPDAIMVVDTQGRLTFASSLTLHTYGIESIDEILGRGPLEWVHPDYHAQLLQAMQTLQSGSPVRNQEYRLIKNDGSVFWGELSASCLTDPQGDVTGIIVIVRDITERKQAEEDLRRYVERLKTLHQIDQAILAAQSIGAIAEAALARIQRLLPNQRAGVILFDPETDDAVVVAALREGEVKQADVHFPLHDFEITDALRQGRVHVVDDLTQLTAPSTVEQSMLARGLRSYLDAPLGIKGNLIGALTVESVEAGAFRGERSEIAREIADQLVIAIQQSRLLEQTQRHAAELEQRVADRTSELTTANEQLAAANDRLAELDRLKSKFVSDVSHELRTPIANLKLYADLLERGQPEKHAHYRTVLKQQTLRLSQLVEDILDLSRLEIAGREGLFGPVDLSAVIDQVVTAHQPRAEAAGLTLTFTAADNLPTVRGDIHQLTQVVTNLVVNALNYTSQGWVRVAMTAQEGRVSVCVADSGQGIAPEDLPHIFDRFYRGRRARQRDIPGTGLGLAIVKEIVELHHGSITVDSRVGEGTTFCVDLPANP
jgi:PAS domain S-box-containing protein